MVARNLSLRRSVILLVSPLRPLFGTLVTRSLAAVTLFSSVFLSFVMALTGLQRLHPL